MNPPPAEQRRSRPEQRQATRDALMDAGIRAFAEKGHDGVNLAKDILEPAGVSVGSFYHQFADKTELLLAIIELATEFAEARFFSSLPDDNSGVDDDALRGLWAAYLNMVDLREDLVTIQLRETHSPHAQIASAIRRLADTRRTAISARYETIVAAGTSVDADATAEMIEALAVGALTTYLRTPAADRPERKAELIDRLTTMTRRGVSGFVD